MLLEDRMAEKCLGGNSLSLEALLATIRQYRMVASQIMEEGVVLVGVAGNCVSGFSRFAGDLGGQRMRLPIPDLLHLSPEPIESDVAIPVPHLPGRMPKHQL